MKKILFLLAILLITVTLTQAQQEPQFTHNMFNNAAINPGYAGVDKEICATIIRRQQWMGFDGTPVTNSFNINGYIKPIKGGVTLTMFQDQIGFNNDFNAKIGYAYHFNVGGGKLSAGLDFGLMNNALNNAQWKTPDGTGAENDAAIPDADETNMVFDMGLGLFYRINDLRVGISTTHLNQASFNLANGSFGLNRHYYFSADYKYQLPNPSLLLKPSIFVKFDGTTAQYSFNSLIVYNNKYWGGITYRMGDAFSFMAGMELMNQIKAGIAYDVTTSKIRKYSDNTFEVIIMYCFDLELIKTPQQYKSVRFL